MQDDKLCNDGVGDLKGISQRLDHLVAIGNQTSYYTTV